MQTYDSKLSFRETPHRELSTFGRLVTFGTWRGMKGALAQKDESVREVIHNKVTQYVAAVGNAGYGVRDLIRHTIPKLIENHTPSEVVDLLDVSLQTRQFYKSMLLPANQSQLEETHQLLESLTPSAEDRPHVYRLLAEQALSEHGLNRKLLSYLEQTRDKRCRFEELKSDLSLFERYRRIYSHPSCLGLKRINEISEISESGCVNNLCFLEPGSFRKALATITELAEDGFYSLHLSNIFQTAASLNEEKVVHDSLFGIIDNFSRDLLDCGQKNMQGAFGIRWDHMICDALKQSIPTSQLSACLDRIIKHEQFFIAYKQKEHNSYLMQTLLRESLEAHTSIEEFDHFLKAIEFHKLHGFGWRADKSLPGKTDSGSMFSLRDVVKNFSTFEFPEQYNKILLDFINSEISSGREPLLRINWGAQLALRMAQSPEEYRHNLTSISVFFDKLSELAPEVNMSYTLQITQALTKALLYDRRGVDYNLEYSAEKWHEEIQEEPSWSLAHGDGGGMIDVSYRVVDTKQNLSVLRKRKATFTP